MFTTTVAQMPSAFYSAGVVLTEAFGGLKLNAERKE